MEAKLTLQEKRIIKYAIENKMEYLEDCLNYQLGEIVDDLNLKFTFIFQRVEAIALARKIFFKG